MALALMTQRITGSGNAKFDFSSLNQGDIGAMVYGIQQMYLASGTPGAQLQTFGVGLSVYTGTGVGYPNVTITQDLASGMSSDSWTDVTVLAYLGSQSPPGVFLSNTSVALGQSALPVATEYPPCVAAGVLSGYTLTFSSSDNNLDALGASVGAVNVPSSTPGVSLVGTGALLGDDSGYSGTVSGGLIAFTGTLTEIMFESATSLSSGSSLNQTFGATVTSAAVLLQSFWGQFPVAGGTVTPDFVSLQFGASDVQWSGGVVTASLSATLSGQYTNNTPYGGQTIPVSAQQVAATYLVVAV